MPHKDGSHLHYGDLGAGAMTGAGTGAQIGTAINPGIGTAIGAGVGFLAGGIFGEMGARDEDQLGVYKPELDLSALQKLRKPDFDIDLMGYLQKGRSFAEESASYMTANAARSIQAGVGRARRAAAGALGQGTASAAGFGGGGGGFGGAGAGGSWAEAAQGIAGQAMQQGTALGSQMAEFDMQKLIAEWNANRQNVLTELEWMNKAELAVAGLGFAPSPWALGLESMEGLGSIWSKLGNKDADKTGDGKKKEGE